MNYSFKKSNFCSVVMYTVKSVMCVCVSLLCFIIFFCKTTVESPPAELQIKERENRSVKGKLYSAPVSNEFMKNMKLHSCSVNIEALRNIQYSCLHALRSIPVLHGFLVCQSTKFSSKLKSKCELAYVNYTCQSFKHVIKILQESNCINW